MNIKRLYTITLLSISCGAVLFLLFFVIPSRIEFLVNVCLESACKDTYQLSGKMANALNEVGISTSFYAVFKTVLEFIIACVYLLVGSVIVLRRPKQRIAYYSFILLVFFGTSLLLSDLPLSNASWAWPVRIHSTIAWVLLIPYFYLYPTGTLVPRWTMIVSILWIVTEIPYSLFPNSALSSLSWPAWINTSMFFGFWLSGFIAQIYRYVKVSDQVQRLQTKWFIFGLVSVIFGTFLIGVPEILPVTNPFVLSLLFFVAILVHSAALIVIPIAIGHAILKYRLWSIDIIINRAILYTILTVLVVTIHSAIVGGLGVLLRSPGSVYLSLISTGIIAVLFQPLTLRVQRIVNRFVYGERDEPYSLLVRLNERLETSIPLTQMLPFIIQTIIHALKLTYADIHLKGGLSFAFGEKNEHLHTFDITYQGDGIGTLTVSRGEKLSSKDKDLLNQLSKQIGISVQSLLLQTELQQSRESLVSTREEERRRLRRDLHDGIGPSLAAQTIKVGVAKQLLREKPETAEQILSTLESDLSGTLAEIRRIIYNLRPPSLDDLGLIGAIDEYLSKLRTTELSFSLNKDIVLPPLSAAVEAAAFRIIQEAATNVVRHSKASRCEICLEKVNEYLKMTISDNGLGIPNHVRKGVGLVSMNERAVEIGGSFRVTQRNNGGTIIEVNLPL